MNLAVSFVLVFHTSGTKVFDEAVIGMRIIGPL